jgi:hypothetical protein
MISPLLWAILPDSEYPSDFPACGWRCQVNSGGDEGF